MRHVARPRLTKDIHVDWVVVGVGLAGLAAARRLAELRPHDSIALLEASAVGDGSHGRNSGFLIDIPHNVGSSMAELHDAQRHLRLARAAIASIKSVVEKQRIACDWSAAGSFHAAVSKAGTAQILKPTMAMLEALHEPYEWLEGQALHERLGFSHFKTGIYPGTVLVVSHTVTAQRIICRLMSRSMSIRPLLISPVVSQLSYAHHKQL